MWSCVISFTSCVRLAVVCGADRVVSDSFYCKVMQIETSCRQSIVQCENSSDWMVLQIVVPCENSSDPMTFKSCSVNSASVRFWTWFWISNGWGEAYFLLISTCIWLKGLGGQMQLFQEELLIFLWNKGKWNWVGCSQISDWIELLESISNSAPPFPQLSLLSSASRRLCPVFCF